MEQKTLDKLVMIVTSFLEEKENRFKQLAVKMNEDYDWFFRYRAVDAFILNTEIGQLKQLLEELKNATLEEVEEIIACNRHYHLQKLVSDPVTSATNIHMENEAYIHERTAHQYMYATLGKLQTVIEKNI